MSGQPFRRYRDLSVEARLDLADGIVAAYGTNADFRAGLDDTAEQPADMAAIIADLTAATADARTADDDQADAQVDEDVASAALKAAVAEAERTYDDVYQRAVAAGRHDPELAAALDFTPRETKRPKRLAQMKQFLDAAEARLHALRAYGVTDARMAAARAARDDAHTKSEAYTLDDVEAQDSTATRDTGMGPLDAVVRDLQARGRIAFRDRPQLLEILGLRPQ